jgi:uncharacterized protein with von Willebrand factor type A (vWA) domain
MGGDASRANADARNASVDETAANSLSAHVPAFCAQLRKDHGFSIGQAQAHDALRAIDVLGLSERARVRTALRLVCCTKRSEVEVFDDAFDRYFTQTLPGIAQPAYAPRHTRPGHDDAPDAARRKPQPNRRHAVEDDPLEGDGGRAAERRPTADESDEAPPSAAALRARYSPLAAQSQPPDLSLGNDPEMLAAAGRFIAAVRLGRSRRWQSLWHGGRFDLRRTVRASLQTGGEPIELRYRGHPLRNPRFAILIDGSRSVSDRTGAAIAFARALVARSPRTSAFFFSTELRDVTRAIGSADFDLVRADPVRRGAGFGNLGGAWGGGTKIGASLRSFVDEHGARVLSPDTVVFIFSDGLDVGRPHELARAMRDIERRSAAVVWLNPHAATPGYAPTARGMRAALPYIAILAAAHNASEFAGLADRVARDPRIRGRRR